MTVNVEAKTFLNYINGEWVTSLNKQVDASINPANKNITVGYVQKSTKEDLDKAVAVAKKAQVVWKMLSGAVRGDYLFKVANILEKNLDKIADTMTREMGKTLLEAKGETARGVAILRYYAGEGMRKVGDVIP